MVFVPDKATRRARYERAIAGVPAAYKDGVEKVQGWKEAAIEGQQLYEEKMRDPNVLSRRERGLSKVSDQDWKNAAVAKGTQRIAAGMQAGSAKQADNYEPIAEALRSVNLPSRTADPMANIDNRVKPIVAAAVNASPKNR
ncbi:MAG: hypothetical protein GYA36_21255 [Veillonellaceae bacterium]|nr:hypothetical protein [Veillonellaceae bacterium]